MTSKKLLLKKDKEFLIFKGHPWVYRDALKEIPPNCENGDEIELFSHKKVFLGKGFFDSESQISIRLVPCQQTQDLGEQILNHLKNAIERRNVFFDLKKTNGFRVTNGEGDFIPGLVIDRYNDTLSVQTYTLGLERYFSEIVAFLLKEIPGISTIWRRNQVRKTRSGNSSIKEGLIHGRNEPVDVSFIENGLKFKVNLVAGQKTGFFLDQRENRNLIRHISRGLSVANVCGYTGAFSVAALGGGAKNVITVDIAEPALIQARKNLELNRFSESCSELLKSDMFEFLENRKYGPFDLVIVDPPSMAQSRSDVPKALKAYSRLNQLAFAKTRSGGFLFSASCSSQITRDHFLSLVTESAIKSGKRVLLLSETHHSVDHPISIVHPEGRYLHGLLMQVL
ncbi:MAG: class I SAM-dependent rRNA methyltransferase [Candidatus Riflebacteria bacterium]|nr:class I SAM-dependent rRNA methyltransferase [Candidatus Riflebacteria bacterium]